MKIKVTETHISNGVRSDANLCPIALAIREQLLLSDKDHVDVGGNSEIILRVCTKKQELTFEIPKEATTFINAFDDREPVEPFEFELTEVEVKDSDEDY